MLESITFDMSFLFSYNNYEANCIAIRPINYKEIAMHIILTEETVRFIIVIYIAIQYGIVIERFRRKNKK